jgi:sugar lactone lactonase YvrE
VDAQGRLWVADYFSNRVLRYDNPSSKGNGGAADGVLGQQDFESASGAGSATLLNPTGVACDAQGRLWISETGRNQVRRYDSPATATALQTADGILGGTGNLSGAGMNQPAGLALDAAGRLFVMDYGFNRVLRFDQAAAKANGANADGVLGEPDFTSYVLQGRSRRTFERPYGIFTDAGGNVWVADEANLRLMRFSPEASAMITQSGAMGSNYSLTFHGEAGITYTVKSSTDLEHWEPEESYPIAVPETQTFTKATAGPKRFYRVEEP